MSNSRLRFLISRFIRIGLLLGSILVALVLGRALFNLLSLNIETYPTSGQEIVYISRGFNSNSDELAVVYEDGMGQIRVTETYTPAHLDFGSLRKYLLWVPPRYLPKMVVGNYKDSPKWSPGCAQLAFVSGIYYWDYDTVDHLGDLVVMNADGSGLRHLTRSIDLEGELVWSPDGTMIAMKTYDDGFYVIEVASGDIEHFLDDTNPEYLATASWSPDSRLLLVSIWEGSRTPLYEIDVELKEVRRLGEELGEWQGYASPIWSPDGTRIAYIFRDNVDTQDIYMQQANGSGRVRLTNGFQGTIQSMAWSPNSEMLLLQANRGWGEGREDIYVIDVSSLETLRLTQHEFYDGEPSWSPDSTRIAFVSQRDNGLREIYTVNRDGTDLTRLTFNFELESSPNWCG